MEKQKKEIIVISLGGSLIVPDEIDFEWIKEFKQYIETEILKGFRFILITGGGKTARRYQNAAQKITQLNSEELDWIGIHSTRLNANLIKSIFKDFSHLNVITNPEEEINFTEDLLVASGWVPGFSTDYVSALLAEKFDVKKIINLSNIDYVCDKDPSKHSDAKIIKNISWDKFSEIVGTKWAPGINSPFDPIASKKAKELGLEVVILNGKNISNLNDFIKGRDFVGTLIK